MACIFFARKTYYENMNGIFFVLFLSSVCILLFLKPDAVLASMLNGGEKAVELTVTMLSVYAVWLGVLEIAKECGLTAKVAKLLKKPIRFLFGSISPKAEEYVAMNLSSNLLGMGGVATPMGINAVLELDKTNDVFAQSMLFVLASTSIQLLPTSVIALRESAGSVSASDIILPSLIATALSSVLAVALLFIFKGREKK